MSFLLVFGAAGIGFLIFLVFPTPIPSILKMSRGAIRYGYPLAVAVGLGAAYWTSHSGPALLTDIASERWPTATGTVQWSRYETNGRDAHAGRISYEYSVGHNVYKSQNITRNLDIVGSGSRREAKSFVTAHPRGATVTVYYDPAQPSIAALIPGADLESYVHALLGPLIFILACLWLLIASQVLRLRKILLRRDVKEVSAALTRAPHLAKYLEIQVTAVEMRRVDLLRLVYQQLGKEYLNNAVPFVLRDGHADVVRFFLNRNADFGKWAPFSTLSWKDLPVEFHRHQRVACHINKTAAPNAQTANSKEAPPPP